jgi:Tol biopolymer transport system component
MTKRLVQMGFFIALTSAAVAQRPALPFAKKNKIDSLALFGEGIISTPDDEFGGTFTPDGKTVFFSKSVPGSYFYTICFSEFKNGTWTAPQVAPFSGAYRDFDPVISPDGETMLFASDRPIGDEVKHDYDIWMVQRAGTGWGKPIRLPEPVNSIFDEHFASMAASGNIYFSSTRPDSAGNQTGSDVYCSKRVDGKYKTAERMNTVSTDAFELDVIIAPDESFILVGAAGRPDGLGGFDIFISRQSNGQWQEAVNAGPKINSPFRDYSPRISPDGKYLFFTSERDFTTLRKSSAPLAYPELVKFFRGTFNGLGNIYQIDLDEVIKSR